MKEKQTNFLNKEKNVFDFKGEVNLSVGDYKYQKESYENKGKNSRQSVCLDLHDCDLRIAKEQLQELVLFCKHRRIKKIKIITGKGVHSGKRGPVIKNFVLDYLASNPNIKWKFAAPKRGGIGVFEIKMP